MRKLLAIGVGDGRELLPLEKDCYSSIIGIEPVQDQCQKARLLFQNSEKVTLICSALEDFMHEGTFEEVMWLFPLTSSILFHARAYTESLISLMSNGGQLLIITEVLLDATWPAPAEAAAMQMWIALLKQKRYVVSVRTLSFSELPVSAQSSHCGRFLAERGLQRFTRIVACKGR